MTNSIIYSAVAICLCLCLCLSVGFRTTWAVPSKSLLEKQSITAYSNGEDLKALSILKEIFRLYPQEKNNPNLLTDMAIEENDISNFTAAISYAKKALTADSRHIGALVELGASLEKLNNSSAPVYFKKAISIPITSEKPWILDERANAFMYLKNYTQAISVSDQILKQSPNNEAALGIKATALLYQGNNTGALAIFNKILYHHIVVWALDNKGILLTRLGNYTGAISVLNTALKINPDKRDAYTYYDLAMAWAMEGFHQHSVSDLKVAIENFNKELIIDPHDQDALKYRGLLLEFLSSLGGKP